VELGPYGEFVQRMQPLHLSQQHEIKLDTKLGEYWTLWGKREQAACILATEERMIYL